MKWLKVTGGATKALAEISMTGYDVKYLGGMLERVSKGATGALGRIEMAGYNADKFPDMVEKIAKGTTSALGEIKMKGFDDEQLSAVLDKATGGIMDGMAHIKMNGYDSTKAKSMITKASSGAISGLGEAGNKMNIRAEFWEKSAEKISQGITDRVKGIKNVKDFECDKTCMEEARNASNKATEAISAPGFDRAKFQEKTNEKITIENMKEREAPKANWEEKRMPSPAR